MGSIKYRSNFNYAQVLAGSREGIAGGIDGKVFIREQLNAETFITPQIGTQGSSEGATGSSTDISGGTDDSLNIAVDGGAIVLVTIPSLVGLNTGSAIEAALESAINTALAAAGQDARVWVNFDGAAPDQYTVYSQKTGTESTVVITNAGADNVADDLGLGIANAGTETAGVNDQDAFLFTTGSINYSQDIESNNHRSGRFHSGSVKRKKVVEFDLSANVNFDGAAGDSLDDAVRSMLKSTYGTETVNSGVSIQYSQGLPNTYMSAVKIGTISGEYFTGLYVKGYTLTLPGDSQATQQFTGMGIDGTIAGIGQVNGAVIASATVILNSTPDAHAKRYTEGAYVMAVGTDGRTITAGADGSLTVLSVNVGTNTIVLNSPITAADNSYIVPWNPGAVQTTVRDNIQTDLAGSVKLFPTSQEICATNITWDFQNDHVDLNNCFGMSTNDGFAAVNRATGTLTMTLDLSNENFGDLVQAREFGGFQPVLILGDTSTRYMELRFSKWKISVPQIDLPENGTVSVDFTGIAYTSEPGADDPFTQTYY